MLCYLSGLINIPYAPQAETACLVAVVAVHYAVDVVHDQVPGVRGRVLGRGPPVAERAKEEVTSIGVTDAARKGRKTKLIETGVCTI